MCTQGSQTVPPTRPPLLPFDPHHWLWSPPGRQRAPQGVPEERLCGGAAHHPQATWRRAKLSWMCSHSWCREMICSKCYSERSDEKKKKKKTSSGVGGCAVFCFSLRAAAAAVASRERCGWAHVRKPQQRDAQQLHTTGQTQTTERIDSRLKSAA